MRRQNKKSATGEVQVKIQKAQEARASVSMELNPVILFSSKSCFALSFFSNCIIAQFPQTNCGVALGDCCPNGHWGCDGAAEVPHPLSHDMLCLLSVAFVHFAVMFMLK